MKRRPYLCVAAVLAAVGLADPASAADSSYPFVGAWVRSDRTCSATSTRERIYSTREVLSSRSRCAIRKVVAGSNLTFELFEKCERPNERSTHVKETIRMQGPDSMTLTRQTARLKLSRSVRFTRCTPGTSPKIGR